MNLDTGWRSQESVFKLPVPCVTTDHDSYYLNKSGTIFVLLSWLNDLILSLFQAWGDSYCLWKSWTIYIALGFLNSKVYALAYLACVTKWPRQILENLHIIGLSGLNSLCLIVFQAWRDSLNKFWTIFKIFGFLYPTFFLLASSLSDVIVLPNLDLSSLFLALLDK